MQAVDPVTDNATDGSATNRSQRTAAGQDRPCDTADSSAGSGVLLALGHACTPAQEAGKQEARHDLSCHDFLSRIHLISL